jgi:hypothetical protein
MSEILKNLRAGNKSISRRMRGISLNSYCFFDDVFHLFRHAKRWLTSMLASMLSLFEVEKALRQSIGIYQ